ncbi:MAG TPA: CYTH and CHAD domain-containing protein [Nocardioides sp.]|nr:CYTH and CHAD domain-containing protein [Nocardioides sp.]
MTVVVDEVETRYAVPEHALLPAFELLPHVGSVEHVGSTLVATYVDTADLDLLRSGITLRRRTGGDDDGWHLELPDRDGRHEVRLPLDDADRDTPPALVAITQVVHRGRPLRRVATVETRRDTALLRDHDGHPFAEVRDDRVTARRLGPDPATVRWREWELELVDGGGPAPEETARLLLAAGARPAQDGTTLERVLTLARPATAATTLPRHPTAADVLGPDLDRRVHELVRLDPLARADVPDAVHRMRVAGRRLRALLGSYRSLLDRDVTDPVRGELAWVVGALGGPRDLEVVQERLDALIGDQSEAAAAGRAALHEQHDRAHAAAVAALASPRYFALLETLTGLAEHPPWRDRAGRPATHELHRTLRKQVRRLDAAAEAARVAHGSEARAAALHDVRRAVKRVRYAVEAALPFLGADAASYAEELASVQDVLGDHHDAVVVRARLREMSPSLPWSVMAPGLHELDQELHEDEQRYAELVARLLRRRHRHWLDD